MKPPMTIREFYEATLKEAGVTPKPHDLEKIAAEKGVDVELVKLAKGYFEELQLDAVPYETEQSRAADAMKMAEAYFAHVAETQKIATEIADGLLRHLSHQAEGYCAQHNLPYSGREACKIAGLQAESADEYEKSCAAALTKSSSAPLNEEWLNKFAELNKTSGQQMPGGTTSGAAGVGLTSGGAGVNSLPVNASAVTPSNAHTFVPGATNPMDAMHIINKTYENTFPAGSTAGNLADFIDRFQGAQKAHPPGTSPTEIYRSMHGTPGGGLGAWAGRNSGALALGGLGLGAAYLWHKKKKEEEANKQQMNMSAMRAAALPAA